MLKSHSLLRLTLSLLSISSLVLATPLQTLNSKSDCNTPTINLTTCSPQYGLGPDFECANFSVPVDHSHPNNGQTIDIWVSRRKANGTSGSLGSLFTNYGGPGTVTSSLLQRFVAGIFPIHSQRLLENFDLIFIDPRGSGNSNPVQCDNELWNKQPELFATDDASFAALVDFNKQFAASCENLTGPLYNFLDTVSVAKDYELVRQALGADKIHFLALSYGTLQGQAYAEHFPEHVGRFALDALVAHDNYDISTIMTEAVTYETTLKQFFSWCNSTSSCPLQNQPVEDYFTTLANSTELPAASCKANGECQPSVSGEDFLFNAQAGLLFVDPPFLPNWIEFASNIQSAIMGDSSAFSNLIQAQKEVPPTDDSVWQGRATMCQDWGSWATSASDIKRYVDITSHMLPLTKGACEGSAALAYCAGMPVPVNNPARRLDECQMSKLPPVLLINAFYDPETSAVWADAVREQVPTGVNIWRDGAGHTSYWLYGDTQQAIDDFLITGTLPADGTIFTS
jgi:pimeloyl-ACP methyl ester carboxylesterase